MRPNSILYSKAFVDSLPTDTVTRYSLRELICLSQSNLVSKDSSPQSSSSATLQSLVPWEFSRFNPENAIVASSSAHRKSLPKYAGKPYVPASSSSSSFGKPPYIPHQNADGSYQKRSKYVPAPSQQDASESQQSQHASSRNSTERVNFDMEAFKMEMKMKDNPDYVAPATHSSSTSSLEGSVESEIDFADIDPTTTGPSRSRFGGKFFKLEDDSHDAEQSQEQVAVTSHDSSQLSKLLSTVTLKSDDSVTLVNDIKIETTRPPVPKAPVVPKGQKKNFDPRVPTSVLRKRQSNSSSSNAPKASQQTLHSETSVSSSGQAIDYNVQLDKSVEAAINSAFIQQQVSLQERQSFINPFPSSSSTIPQSNSLPQQHVFPPGIPVPLQAPVHQQPHQQQFFPQLPPELPPPHVFVQMLMANNIPVPVELQQFAIPPPNMGISVGGQSGNISASAGNAHQLPAGMFYNARPVMQQQALSTSTGRQYQQQSSPHSSSSSLNSQ